MSLTTLVLTSFHSDLNLHCRLQQLITWCSSVLKLAKIIFKTVTWMQMLIIISLINCSINKKRKKLISCSNETQALPSLKSRRVLALHHALDCSWSVVTTMSKRNQWHRSICHQHGQNPPCFSFTFCLHKEKALQKFNIQLSGNNQYVFKIYTIQNHKIAQKN